MQNKKLLILKSLAIMLFAFCLQTPECSAKGNPAGKAIKKVGKAVGGSVKKAKKLLGDVKKEGAVLDNTKKCYKGKHEKESIK